MTDELTPEEQEALRKLPRERMPSAGLEERVVGALRARGVLSTRRRRTIAITNSRVVGFLAACVALVIGAYSIGLRMGGEQAIPRPTTLAPETKDRVTTLGGEARQPEKPGAPAETPTEAERAGRTLADETGAAKPSVASDADQRNEEAQAKFRADKPAVSVQDEEARGGALKKEDFAEAPPEPVARPTEPPATKLSRQLEASGEGRAKTGSEAAAEKDKAEALSAPEPAAPKAQSEPRKETRAPGVMLESVRPVQPKGSTGAPQPLSTQASSPVTLRTLSFLLNGTTPVVVEAPDSIRVVQDEHGRVIIIYTSDGPIRIRLADED